MELLTIPFKLYDNLPLVWTFTLLVSRFTTMMIFLPGIGMGFQGLLVRGPTIAILALVSTSTSQVTPLPPDTAIMVAQLVSEMCLGVAIGMIPLMIVSSVQMASHLAATSMGLGMGNLVDPALGINVSDLGRIMGDLTIIIFLAIGGHYVVLEAAAGMGGTIVPGSFIIGEHSIGVLLDRSADIFRMGVTLSAPVIVALLLTQFVMGLIAKAVPSVNIFIVSFPLTIGIGLILSVLAMKDILNVVQHEFTGIENSVIAVSHDTEKVEP